MIIEWDAKFSCCHQGGSLEFGPDGILYIGTGDNFNTDASDAAGWAVPYASSMNPKNSNGKILRVLPKAGGGYTVPEGNLFKTSEEGNPEIYLMGSRNAYRITSDPRTGWTYWGDIGPDGPRMEEFNVARNEPGNYGWPAFIGENEPTPGNGGWAAIKDQRPALKVPLISFNGTTDKVHTGPTTTQGMDIRGRAGWAGPIYYYNGRSPSKTKFPPSMHGTLTIFDWHLGWIKTVNFNDAGYVKSVTPFTTFSWVHMIDMRRSACRPRPSSTPGPSAMPNPSPCATDPGHPRRKPACCVPWAEDGSPTWASSRREKPLRPNCSCVIWEARCWPAYRRRKPQAASLPSPGCIRVFTWWSCARRRAPMRRRPSWTEGRLDRESAVT